jgi:ribonuclease E
MAKEMVINALAPENIRVAFLENGRLAEFFENSQETHRTRSNIYMGKVTSIQPSLDACFVEYGQEKQGFLPVSEIVPSFRSCKPGSKTPARIENLLKRNQLILVQVEKEPVSTKGARLTTDISLAGRYLVLTPFSENLGVSRKIEDQEQRRDARNLGSQLKVPKGMGFIIRTAGRGENKRAFEQDLKFLVRLWNDIQNRFRKSSIPGLIHAEANLIQRVLRDYYTNDFDHIWIDNEQAKEKARRFFRLFAPRQQKKLKFYSERVPIFSHYGVEEQIEGIQCRRVELPSGGSLVIDQTEALVAIDVNSGKMTRHHDQEGTAFETNMEASAEIARQLRLRNLGGIIVIDFIDMTGRAHKAALEKSLRKAMSNDKSRHQIGKISAFGLCTLTRQRIDRPIGLIGYRECPTCHGDGKIRAAETIATRLLRKIETQAAYGQIESVQVRLHPDEANFLQNKRRGNLMVLENEFGIHLDVVADPSFGHSEEQVNFVRRAEVDNTSEQNKKSEFVSDKQAEAHEKPENQKPLDKTTSTPKKRRRRRRKKKTVSTPGQVDPAQS